MELNESVAALNNLQHHFVKICQGKLDESPEGQLKIHKDSAYTENPMEREDIEESVKVENLSCLDNILNELQGEAMPNLECIRVPVVEERAPDEDCFDILVESLKNEPASTQCIFSCQMGRGRTTIGMVVACLIKEIQVSVELKKMGEIGLVPQATVDNLISQKFESPLPKSMDDDDPFIKGEFDVIKELLEKVRIVLQLLNIN